MEINKLYDTILILDFGSQYSHLIARRVRELGVYCELLPCTTPLAGLAFRPKGIILSGGPSSVYEPDAPHVDAALWTGGLDVPIPGICYGLQEIVWAHGGTVAPSAHREFGHADLELELAHDGDDGSTTAANGPAPPARSPYDLFCGLATPMRVWMSHGDAVTQLPDGFVCLARTPTAPYAAIGHRTRPLFGLQFHPEVSHSPDGPLILGNFVRSVCGITEQRWHMDAFFVQREVARIRTFVGEHDHVVGAVSGGVDSTVAAKLVSLAIGDRFHAILVDNGLMREREVEHVVEMLGTHLGIPLEVIDAADDFLSLLADVVDPETKRKRIGNAFIRVFEGAALALDARCGHNVKYLLQGTLYPDVIESMQAGGVHSALIKSHHNVGGLVEDMKLCLVEPLRKLFKDEVRELGAQLGIPDTLLWRHPFPGPGLAIRIVGAVTPAQLHILRQTDTIFTEEIRRAGLYRAISQAFTVLLPIQSVGVMGDGRTYEQVVCCRAVQSVDFMTADWFPLPHAVMRAVSSRITNEVKGVNRVVYDISSKPPSTIEWE